MHYFAFVTQEDARFLNISILVLAAFAGLIYLVYRRINKSSPQETNTEKAIERREYLTYSYENTDEGLRKKDEDTQGFAAHGYRITSEHIEQGHIKGNEQCCWALICLPGIFLAGRTPGTIIVTYGWQGIAEGTKKCPFCAETILQAAVKCRFCGESLNRPPPTP